MSELAYVEGMGGGGAPEARPAALPLDKKGNYPGRTVAKWDLRAAAAKCLPDEAVARCGHRVGFGWECHGERAAVLQKGKHGHFFGGVQTCGSVWVCPVCAAKVARERAAAVARSVEHFEANGGRVGMFTLTLWHGVGHKLADLLDVLKDTWNSLKGQRFWKIAVKAGELCGGMTATEVTRNEVTGWHPHLHVLLYFGRGMRAARLCELINAIEAYWLRALARAGHESSPGAQHFRLASTGKAAGDYLTKFGVEWEVTHGHQKRGRGSRTPWDLLRSVAETRDSRDAALFQEYAVAFKGRRQLVPFGCVRKEWGKQPDDGELANRADEPEAAVVCAFNSAQLRLIAERRLEKRLQEAANLSGLLGIQALMNNEGLGNPLPAQAASRVGGRVNRKGRR